MARKKCPECGRGWNSWEAHRTGPALACWTNQAVNHCWAEMAEATAAGWAAVGSWRGAIERAELPFRLVADKPYAVPVTTAETVKNKWGEERIISKVVGGTPRWEESEWAPWWALKVAELGGVPHKVSMDKRVRMLQLLRDNPRERELLIVQASLLSKDRDAGMELARELGERLHAGHW